jgi:hypothetical protein
LHALCIGSNPCRPYETHVYVGFGQSESETHASATDHGMVAISG